MTSEHGRGQSETGVATGARRQPRDVSERARYRLVPSAVTPVGAKAVAGGCLNQLRGTGRDQFRTQIRSALDGDTAATYTSFRRALADCLQTMAASGDGGSVLVPSFCSSDYPDAIDGAGLETERYDVDPATLGADLDSLQSDSFDDVLAVVAVNVLGYTSRMDELARVCASQDVYLVEALGYAFGAEYRGQPLGTFGDCAVLNFQQGKPIPVGGGMVVSQDPALTFSDEGRPAVAANVGLLSGYAALSRPRLYGLYDRFGQRLLSALGAGRPSTHPESKEDVAYDPPYATMSDFQGAVGSAVLEHLPAHRRHRAETARFYDDTLAGIDSLERLDTVDGLENHQYVRYPVLAASTALRDRLVTRLDAAGVQASILYDWPPMEASTTPGGATLQHRLLTVPTHPYVTGADRHRIGHVLRETATEWGDQ